MATIDNRNAVITGIQIEGNDIVSFLNGTTYIRAMSQIVPQSPAYISYTFDSITISQVGGDSFTFSVYTIDAVGGIVFVPLSFQDTPDVIQERTIEIYRLLVTSIFKGCCECGNTEPECSIQYTAGNGTDAGTFLYDTSGVIRVNYFTANNQDFRGFWPIIQDGSWIFVFSKTDPTVYGVYQLSNYTDGGDYARFDATLLNGPGEFPDGTSLCVDVTSVGGSLVQDWQDTLNISSVLTQNNTVDGGGFNFAWDNVNRYTIDSINYQAYTADDGAGNVGSIQIDPGAVTISGTSFIDIITPNYGAATAGMVLALDGSGHVEYTTAGTGTVVSVGLVMPSAFTVSNSPIIISGDIDVVGAGTDLEYINGLGELATLPVYTVENGLHAFGGVPGEAPPDPFLFHLGGRLREDTLIETTDGTTEFQLSVRGSVDQNTQFPFGVANLGIGGVATFQDYGSGDRPHPSVEIVGDVDLVQPLLELRMEGNLPNGTYPNSTGYLSLKYEGATANNVRSSIDFEYPDSGNNMFLAGRLTTELASNINGNERSKFDIQLIDGGNFETKLELNGTGQLTLNEYGIGTFINSAPTFALVVDNTGLIWKKALVGGGTVTEVTATGLLTTSPDPIETTGVVTSEMDSGFLVGRYSSGTGVFEQITIGDGLTLSATGELTADGGGGGTYTVNNGLSPDPLDPNNFQLGGPLVNSTIIDGVANTHSMTFDAMSNFNVNANAKIQLTAENPALPGQFSQLYSAGGSAFMQHEEPSGDRGLIITQPTNSSFGFANSVGLGTNVVATVSSITLSYVNSSIAPENYNISIDTDGIKTVTPNVQLGTAVAGQVLTLINATTGQVEFQDGGGGGGTYDSDQGIYKDTSLTNDTFQLGAPTGLQSSIAFEEARFIDADTFRLSIEGNPSADTTQPDGCVLDVIVGSTAANFSTGIRVDTTAASKGSGIYINAANAGMIVDALGTSLILTSPGGTILSYTLNDTTPTDPQDNTRLVAKTNAVSPSVGFGPRLAFTMEDGTAAVATAQGSIGLFYTDVNNATLSANMEMEVFSPIGFDPTTPGKIKALTLRGDNDGQLQLNKYTTATAFQGVSGASIGVLNVDDQGNVFVGEGGGGSSPLTTKGDIYTFDTGDTRLPVGTNGQMLYADSTTATGLKWDDAPSGGGAGGGRSYYLNGSINQGTFAGIVDMKEMSPVPISGPGTNFTISTVGYIASFITDAGDPNKVLIPAGNWNFELWFSATSGGGTPSFYVELSKYDTVGGTFTPIASGSGAPEAITGGTVADLYFTALSVPQTTLALTDRLAVRVFVDNGGGGRTITLFTEDNRFSQIITSFPSGIASLNGLTAFSQTFATPGTTGTAPTWSSSTSIHTLNIPLASAAGVTAGLISKTEYDAFNGKVGPTRSISTTAPLAGGGDLSADRTLSIADAAADGATKGAAAFTASDFISAAGVISIDYANGQSASGTNKGFLTSADWTRFDSFKTQTIGVTVDGSGGVITAGNKGYVRIPYACTISFWSIITTGGGIGASLSFDILRANNAIPTSSIIGGGTKPNVSGTTQLSANTAPSGWTSLNLVANDILAFNVDSGAAIYSWAILQLTITRT